MAIWLAESWGAASGVLDDGAAAMALPEATGRSASLRLCGGGASGGVLVGSPLGGMALSLGAAVSAAAGGASDGVFGVF
jgi:hypothetical protein